mgnify:CR=1 FL=1
MSLQQARDNSYEVYIKSSKDKNPTDTLTNFTARFNIPVMLGNGNYEMALQSLAVCNTIPQFKSDNNKFNLGINEYSIDLNTVFNNATELCTELTNLSSSYNLVFSLDALSKKIKIQNNDVAVRTFDLSQQNYRNFWNKIGLETTINSTQLEVQPSESVILDNIPFIIATQRVYLSCNEIVSNSVYNSGSSGSKGIMSYLDINTSYGTYSTYRDNTFYFHDLITNNELSSLTFRLLDDNYEEIENLNGGSVNISLIIRKA